MSGMSGVAEPSRRTGWRPRFVWIALALSLTLNVFFVGGLMWMKLSHHSPLPPIERMHRLGQSLDLNNDQRRAFEQFLRVVRVHGHAVRDANQPILDSIWAEIAKPNPDEGVVAKLSGEVSNNRHAFQKEAASAFFDFAKTLSPEQRAKLADIARGGGDEPTRRLFQVIAP
jgi:uncharacterized membrane protein